VRGLPSGSLEWVPSKLTGTLTVPVYGPPASAVGGRFWMGVTVMLNDFWSLNPPVSVALTVAEYVPRSPVAGARCAFPVVALVVVTVRNNGPETFANVSASPSGSLAV